MNTEQEYKEAKLSYECLGMMNTPVDPVEAMAASVEYEKACARYFKAQDALRESLTDKGDS